MLRLRELRIEKKLSQKEFAKQFGVAQNTVSNWENGNRSLDAHTIQQLANFFNVSTDYLLGNQNDRIQNKVNEDDVEDIRRIERARNKMHPEDKKKMMKILAVALPEYFSDDYKDEDVDE